MALTDEIPQGGHDDLLDVDVPWLRYLSTTVLDPGLTPAAWGLAEGQAT